MKAHAGRVLDLIDSHEFRYKWIPKADTRRAIADALGVTDE